MAMRIRHTGDGYRMMITALLLEGLAGGVGKGGAKLFLAPSMCEGGKGVRERKKTSVKNRAEKNRHTGRQVLINSQQRLYKQFTSCLTLHTRATIISEISVARA